MLSRRNFLQDSLAIVSLGVSVPSVFTKAVALGAEASANAGVGGKTLVVVQLAGGVDGLNVTIPFKDPAYRQNRNVIAVAEKDWLPISDRIALHPSMGRLKEVFDAGKLAVVEGVGYPNPNFSHFRAMDIWQSADPDGVAKEGWLGKYFDGLTDADGHPLVGMAYGNRLPAAFNSDKVTVPAVENLDDYGFRNLPGDPAASARQTSLLKLYDFYKPANTPFAALLDTTMESAYESSTQLKTAAANYKPAAPYPQSSLASGLQLLAELIDSGGSGGSPLRVGHVMLGGFDTHTNEEATLDRLLRETSEGLHAFWTDVNAHGHGDDVVVMTWSEFGRRVKENANRGTDHGSVGPMFVLGNAVKGGFYGEPASLTNLDNGNLKFTTDFRSVYATLLDRWLHAPADDILGQRFPQLNFLPAG